MQQSWLGLLRKPTRRPDSLSSCPLLTSLLPCGCQGEDTQCSDKQRERVCECKFKRRCCLRHAREAFPHVSDDVDDHTAVLFHPRGVDCPERTANNQTEGFQKHTKLTIVVGLLLTLLAAVEGSGQVGVYHGFPAFRCHVLRRAAELTSSIVHQEVYPAVLLQHRWHKGLHLPHRGGQNHKQQWNLASVHWQHDAVSEDEGVHRPTSSSFRMLHGRGVTHAGLEGGIFCLISWAAASNLSTFLLEITTLQPEHKIGSHDMTASTREMDGI